jgi:mannose-6-phosphate isomerase-like protein (cupin superfamily)
MREARTVAEASSSDWPYPAELDAMVAAPDYHDVLFEDDRVRVLDAHVAPGDTVPVHTHQWGGVLYILSDSDFVRRDPDGTVLVDTRLSASGFADGSALWGDPLTPHSLENVGSKELRTITVEMKRAGTG